MPNPITIHHGSSAKKQFSLLDCPENCNYPIRGLTWDIVEENGTWMSVQQSDFFGGHMQILELLAEWETEISFTAQEPAVFMVVMIEGFFRFYQGKKFLSYAMGGSYYMAYNHPGTAQLRASAGKHAILLFALDWESLNLAGHIYPKMEAIMKRVHEKSQHTIRLPMCRMSRQVIDLWNEVRKIRTNSHVRRGNLSRSVSLLLMNYHEQLQQGDIIKDQLSAEIANALIMYIEANYTSYRDVKKSEVARHIGESDSKIDGYCAIAFRRSLHKHIIDLRMEKASRLLADTDLSVTTICYKIGLSKGSYFFRLFSRYFNCTPSEYRKSHR